MHIRLCETKIAAFTIFQTISEYGVWCGVIDIDTRQYIWERYEAITSQRWRLFKRSLEVAQGCKRSLDATQDWKRSIDVAQNRKRSLFGAQDRERSLDVTQERNYWATGKDRTHS